MTGSNSRRWQRILIINKSYQKRLFVRLEGVSAEKKGKGRQQRQRNQKIFLRVSARAFWGTKEAKKGHSWAGLKAGAGFNCVSA